MAWAPPISPWNLAPCKGWKLRKHEERALSLWRGTHLTAQLRSQATPSSLWAAAMGPWETVQERKHRQVLCEDEAAVLAVGARGVFPGNPQECLSDLLGRAKAGTLALFLGRLGATEMVHVRAYRLTGSSCL